MQDDITVLNCDSVYNRILNYYIEKYKKKNLEIDVMNIEIKCFFYPNLIDEYSNEINKKSYLKKLKKQNHKLFIASLKKLPFYCPITISINFLNSDDHFNILLSINDIKDILKHVYKDSKIEFQFYTLEEIVNSSLDINYIKPFKSAIISKSSKEIDSYKKVKRIK